MKTIAIAGALTVAMSAAALHADEIPTDDLLREVAALASGGNPASMITWGEARPLVVSPEGTIFAAASRLGRGRLVILGHGGFTQTTDADSEVFGANAVAWLGARRPTDRRPLRVFGMTDEIEAECARRGLLVERVNGSAREVNLEAVDVVIGSPQGFEKAERLEELDRWVRRGGGLLVTETAWGQLQLNPGLTIDGLAANRLLADAGVRFTDGAHSGFGPEGTYPVRPELLELANAEHGLEVLAGEREGDVRLAARIVGNAFGAVPLDSTLVRRADRLAREHAEEIAASYAGLPDTPITPERQPLARALFDLDARRAQELPPERLKAHPSSDAFPGPVGSTKAGRVRLELDATVPGWHSTGLYARPGEVVRVKVGEDAAAAEAGLVIQIGAWQDPHDHPYRLRLRSALRRYPVMQPITPVASAIGGPIYVDVPCGFAHDGPLVVDIDNAVRAPHYHHGVTDVDEWRETIRHYDAPWAEFGSDELIFTVPSEAIRNVERPDLVMAHWNRVHEAMESLEPRTDNHWADRPYRYVADASVSWGYMYCPAEAPIVIPLNETAPMFDLANFDAEGPNHLWGQYHEMGHAHQNPLWTDGATGEVTVNIFTVYALHTVNGYALDDEVMRTTPAEARGTFARQRDLGDPFDQYGGPFEKLQFYALLWHKFGFEPFHVAFDSIRALPTTERPRNDGEERNTFLVHFGRAVERDLSAYFAAWGIDVTDASRAALRAYPAWMPEE